VLLALGLGLACRPGGDGTAAVDSATVGTTETGTDSDTPTDSSPDSDTPTDTTTDTDTGGIGLPETCEPPASLPADPLTALGAVEDKQTGAFFELLDLEVYPALDRVLAVGEGGLMVFGTTSDKPDLKGQLPADGKGRFVKLQRLDSDHVAVTNWNANASVDFAVIDISDIDAPVTASTLPLDQAAGMGWKEPYLYVGALDGRLHVLDASDPTRVSPVIALEGLGTPYAIEVSGDQAYIADPTLGLVTVDLADPRRPALGTPDATALGAWDLATDADHVYVAAGSGGVLIYDRLDPLAPQLVAQLDDVGSVVGVDVDGDLLTAVSHADLLAFDITDRQAPMPLGKQDHNQFGLAVQLVETRISVADWAFLSVWQLDPAVRSPEMDLQSSELWFTDGAETKALEITNLGADTLELVGATVGDDRVSVAATADFVAPGESTVLQVQFDPQDPDDALNTTLCLATNDPDEPVVHVPLASATTGGLSELGVGEAAPDFTLNDIDGGIHRLSDQLGHPVVLLYFATW